MVEERDATGRAIRKFYGDVNQVWAPFRSISRVVSRINTNPESGSVGYVRGDL